MSHCLQRLKIFPAILSCLFALLPFSIMTTQDAWAQAGGATISGLITDKTGALIRNVEVNIRNVDNNVLATTVTNGAGLYNFTSLQPGTYVLSVHKQGFRSVNVPRLTIYTQDNIERNFTLEVGSVAESVTVTSATTNDSPAVSLTVSREFVEDTPLNGRSFQDLIQIAPGAASTGPYGGYSIDGQRPDSNGYAVDGVSAALGGQVNSVYGSGSALNGNSPAQTVLGTTQSLVSVDALQEFTIQTAGYTAEFGRTPGGQIQFTTRSGTNGIHGSLSEYFRNTALDANSNMNDHYGDPKTAEHQNDFGGTIGGPLIIPKVYNGKNRTFYFFSYEGLRLLLPSSETEYVPTQAFRDQASASVKPYLEFFPLPDPTSPSNADGCTVNGDNGGTPVACDSQFNTSYSYPNKVDNFGLRLDQALGSRYHAFIRYADTPSSQRTGLELPTAIGVNTRTLTVGVTANISQSMFNDLRMNYSYDGESEIGYLNAVHGGLTLNRDLLLPSAYDGHYSGAETIVYVPGTSLLEEIYVGGGGTAQHQYQIVDGFSLTRGRHSMKFGVDFRRLSPTQAQAPYDNEVLIEGLSGIQSGYAEYYNTSSQAETSPVFHNLSIYAQDHLTLSSRLSIDYGLRWEFNPPPGPDNGEYPVTLNSDNLAVATLAPYGSKPYKTRFDKFAPRIGFAWNAVNSPKHQTTLRGGFGIFFDTAQSSIAGAYSGSYPFSKQSSFSGQFALPLTTAQLAPPSGGVAIASPYPFVELTSPSLTIPYTEQWSISLDQELRPHNTLTVSYVGNNGRKLLSEQQYLPKPFGNAAFPSGFYLTNNVGQSSYNALQVQDLGRIANGLDVIASFTYGHSLDNASNTVGQYSPLWGNSNYDLRKVANVALNYKMPVVSGNGMTHSIISGWTLSNRFTTESGTPFSLTESYTISPTGTELQLFPNLVPNVPIYLHGRSADLNGSPVPASWRLNRAAFACTTDGSTEGPCTGNSTVNGDLGRNFLRTPSFWALNEALQRVVRVGDKLEFKLRAEAFNVLNHPNFSQPYLGLSESNFGELNYSSYSTIGSNNQLYAMGGPRSLQLSLKLQF